MSHREVSHYVVTASPPGGVLHTCKCRFLSPDTEDVVIGKSRRLEVRQFQPDEDEDDHQGEAAAAATTTSNSPFPVVFSCPVNGRITSLVSLEVPHVSETSLLFLTTDQYQYAVIGYTYTANTEKTSAAATVASTGSTNTNSSTTTHHNHYHIQTYASGSLQDDWNVLGNLSECGPLVAVDPHMRCIALHVYDGLMTIFPISTTSSSHHHRRQPPSVLLPMFHARLEERTILSLTMLHHLDPTVAAPHVCLLHQDSRGAQHITTHVVDLLKSQLWNMTSSASVVNSSSTSSSKNKPLAQREWLKKSRIDGGSRILIPVPPRAPAAAAAAPDGSSSGNMVPSGGVVILGQRQITFCAMHQYKVMPIPPALLLSWDALPPDVSGMPRFLLGDEFGNVHMLTLITATASTSSQPQQQSQDAVPNFNPNVIYNKVIALQLDTLGSCTTLAHSLQYLDQGLVFCGSTLGDSQLIQIHDEPIPVEDQQQQQQQMYGNSNSKDGESNNNNNNNDDDDDAMMVDSNNNNNNNSKNRNNDVDDIGLELNDTTYLSVVEEYTHLGPIVDFDLVPMAGTGEQSQVVTASGSSKSGSLRVIRNGIGMKEYASVELSGIQNMWSLRQAFDDTQDAYLVQSFVGETRVLGVTTLSASGGGDQEMAGEEPGIMEGDDNEEEQEDEEEVGGTLEEVVLPGLESNASTLYVTNVVGNLFLQITETQLRLASATGELLDTHCPECPMTVATANEAGQIVVALRGGMVLSMAITKDQKIQPLASKQMDREVSCLTVHPFVQEWGQTKASKASLCAVGLWDDFTVRLLSLQNDDDDSSNTALTEVLQIHLSTEEDEEGENAAEGQRRNNRNNMMARSLCLITLDHSSSNTSINSGAVAAVGSHHHHNSSTNNYAHVPGVNMLFVGLGDGTLVSFAVVQEDDDGGTTAAAAGVRVQSKKEVSLGTQRINLIPLHNEKGGTCVLATGDRPTVIYLAGGSSTATKNYNPKLCYSNVNLSPSEETAADNNNHNDVSRPHAHESIAVNVAAPFFSPLLFDAMGQEHYSLCVADDANLRLGVIDDIEKLHVTTCRLGMAPRRIVHCPEGHLFAVGCIESGIKQMGVGGPGAAGEMSMGNCIRFLDDSTFDDIERIDLEPSEMVLSMVWATMREFKSSESPSSGDAGSTDMVDTDTPSEYKSYLIIGTAYALHDEDEPTKGRILVLSCSPDEDNVPNKRPIKTVTELQVRGGVYSMCQFYDGKILVTINSKTQLCQLVNEGTGIVKLAIVGVGHHGHILSLFVNSRVPKALGPSESGSSNRADAAGTTVASEGKEKASVDEPERLAIVGDLMRSISLVQYYPEHDTLEEVARDFNTNWTTAAHMLTDDFYIGGENWNNLYVLRRNTKASSEEVRCRLDTVGEFHLGEMCNKFMRGSLVMPSSNSSSDATKARSASRRRSLASPKKGDGSGKVPASPGGVTASLRSRRPAVIIGSQTIFGTVDGTLGVILGLDGPTSAFFACLERAMQKVITPVGHFSHQQFRAFNAEQRLHPSHGFVDGDLIESFLDLDKTTMGSVVHQMNKDGGWEVDESAFAAGASTDKDAADNVGMGDDQRPELSVDDVLAVVEEMTMLH